MELPRLRSLGLGARVGLIGLCLTMLGGLVASGKHLINHHQNRDEKPGVSMEDLRGAYHGVQTTAVLTTTLNRGHPESLGAEPRAALLKWLSGDRLAENYDNPDLGDNAPAEIIARSCLECHAKRNAEKSPIAREYPLDSWNDVKRLTVSRRVEPIPEAALMASTHAHAVSLALMGFVGAGLMLMTSWPRRVAGALITVAGVGLAVDIACWWLARHHDGLVYVIAGAGGAFNAAIALMMVLTIVDLCLPARKT